MMLLHHAQKRNRNVLLALAVWFGLAAIMFAVAGVQVAGYRGAFGAYQQDMRGEVTRIPGLVKERLDASDITATAAALREAAAALVQKTGAAPSPPNIMGLHIGGDTERRKQKSIARDAQVYAAALKDAADCMEYQHKIAHSLQSLSLKDASNYNQIIDLADAWKNATEIVHNSAKPDALKEVTATLLQKMSLVENNVRELAELYKKADADAFKAKQLELSVLMEDFKPIGDQFAVKAGEFDAALARAAASLNQNL